MSDPFDAIPPHERATPAESLADMTAARDDASSDIHEADASESAPSTETPDAIEAEETTAPDEQAPEDLTLAAGASLGAPRRHPAWKRAMHFLFIVAAFGAMGTAIFLLTRDTWEENHLRELASMKTDAENAMAAGDFDKACQRFDDLRNLVGNHPISTASGHDLLADAAAERTIAEDSRAIVRLRQNALDAESRHDWKGAVAAYGELLARAHDLDHPPRAVVKIVADAVVSLKSISGQTDLTTRPATAPAR